MNQFFISFALGFLCTASLFMLCLIVVLGGKTLIKNLYRLIPAKPVAVSQKQEPKPKPPRVQKSPQVVRSIEIDPSTVDRIYVKKSS